MKTRASLPWDTFSTEGFKSRQGISLIDLRHEERMETGYQHEILPE